MSFDNIPKSSEKSIQDHLRFYYACLQTGSDFNVSSLFNTYRLSNPSLHKLANSPAIDVSSLSYAVPRLPACIFYIKHVIIAQTIEQLLANNIDVGTWELQSASARRRQNYYDHVSQTLVILINSDSDVDDFINCLVAFQLERQKISTLDDYNFSLVTNQQKFASLGIDYSGWQKLQKIFGPDHISNLTQFHIYTEITVRCLPVADSNPESVVADWWKRVKVGSLIFNFDETPIYFISSNLHSFTNVIGGYVNQQQDYIISHIEKNYPDLYQQWVELKNAQNQLRVIDFLYYVSSKYFKDLQSEAVAKSNYEESLGIRNLKINTQLPCLAQLIPISSIAKSRYKDPNLTISSPDKILNSKSYILNIEYPLGMSAYFILKEILSKLKALKGVYVIGKAAILSGAIGDIQIPSIVFDERYNNIFHPPNIFNQYFPFTAFVSSVLQNQKAISVYGTYLENELQLNNYISSGFNIIEMESGPYLSAIHNHFNHLDTIPDNDVVHLNDLPFDLGIINYASDNPLSHSLGDGVMSLKGVEPTYLAALTTLQRIIDLESI